MSKAHFDPSYARRATKIVGVMGSGREAHPELAETVGRVAAELGCHLLTGGGGGVMEAASAAFAGCPRRAGLVLGVIRAAHPHRAEAGERAYTPRAVNAFVELPIFTHLSESSKALDSRNPINVLTADVVVALPGGTGTYSELELALEYGMPTVLFLGGGRIGGQSAEELEARFAGRLAVARNEAELAAVLRRCLGLGL